MKAKNLGPPVILPPIGKVDSGAVVELPDDVAEALRGHRFWEVGEAPDKPAAVKKKGAKNG